ncbi:MAG: hypothetical protein ACK5M3_18335 [Dysgonomonas sp.]
MKKLLFNLLAISMLFAFSACGSDDEKEQKFFTGDCKQTVLLKSGAAGTTVTIPATSTLEDMLKNVSGYGSPISSGELLLGSGSNTTIDIVGLPVGTALKDFKLNINGIEQNFGEISNEKANLNLYTTTYADYFKRVFNQMVANKKLDIKVTFAPTVETDNDVKLEIVFSGRFSYWVKL